MLTNLQKKITACLMAAITIVIGVLCIIANASANNGSYSDASDAYANISIVVGVVLIVLAAIGIIVPLVLAILARVGAFAKGEVISSGVLLAAGIFCVSNKSVVGDLIVLFLNFIPYVLIVVGSIIAVDAILEFVFAIINKQLKAGVAIFVVKLVVAAIAIVLGALAMGDNWVGNNKLLIFGIVLIIAGALQALSAFVSPTILVVANKKEQA